MKNTCSALAFVACSLMLGMAGCQDISTDNTGVETTTTSGAETTTAVAAETTSTTATGLSTTTSAVAKPSAVTTTTKASSAIGALPQPKPTSKLIKGTWTWDVDQNIDGGGSGADLWYRIADEVVHFLEPQNGAGLAKIAGKSFDAVTRSDLQALSYSAAPLYTESVDDPDVLMVGSIFALRTNTGQYAKMQVVGFEPGTLNDGTVLNRYSIRLIYVLYPR